MVFSITARAQLASSLLVGHSTSTISLRPLVQPMGADNYCMVNGSPPSSKKTSAALGKSATPSSPEPPDGSTIRSVEEFQNATELSALDIMSQSLVNYSMRSMAVQLPLWFVAAVVDEKFSSLLAAGIIFGYALGFTSTFGYYRELKGEIRSDNIRDKISRMERVISQAQSIEERIVELYDGDNFESEESLEVWDESKHSLEELAPELERLRERSAYINMLSSPWVGWWSGVAMLVQKITASLKGRPIPRGYLQLEGRNHAVELAYYRAMLHTMNKIDDARNR